MPTTTRGFRYPALSDTPDVPRDIGNLAADVDADHSQGTFATRPAAAKIGRRYYATDTGITYLDTGTAWVILGANDVARTGITNTFTVAQNLAGGAWVSNSGQSVQVGGTSYGSLYAYGAAVAAISPGSGIAFMAGSSVSGAGNYPNIRIDSNGIIRFGPGGAADVDTTFYRTGAGVLKTDGTLNAVVGYQVNGTALAATHLSNGVTGAGAVVLAGAPTITGAMIANGTIRVGPNTAVSAPLLAAVGAPNGVEFGHSNAAGYRGVLGAQSGNGRNFLAFQAEGGSSVADTYRTRGIKASIIRADLLGGFEWGTVANGNADNQAFITLASLTTGGIWTVGGKLSAAADTPFVTGGNLWTAGATNLAIGSAGAGVVQVFTNSVARLTVSDTTVTTPGALVVGGSGGNRQNIDLKSGHMVVSNGSAIGWRNSADTGWAGYVSADATNVIISRDTVGTTAATLNITSGLWTFLGSMSLAGAGSSLGFFGAAGTTKRTGYGTPSVTTAYAALSDASTLGQVAAAVASLINDLKAYGIIGA